MMAKTAPSPIDVVDFQFKLQCKLKAFENDSHDTFKLPCSLISCASKYGLLFVGTSMPKFQVIQIQDIQNYTVKDGHVGNYKRRYINLSSNPRYLGVNCDSTKLCVIVEKDGCVKAVIYDVVSFLKQNVVIFQEFRLSATPGVNILDICWNPSVPSMLAVCKDDGSLGLYDVKETGIEIKELPKTACCTCSCWSPKGKQLVVGTSNGKLTQHKLDLQVAKSINPPPINGSPYPISIQWISNYQFIGVYKTVLEDVQMSLIVVDAPKAGETTYTNYDDVCYSYGTSRPHQFYMLQQPLWNILLVASSNSMEVGVMHLDKDSWTQWILTDSARAELPLNAIKQETLPVGLGFDVSSTKPLPWGEGELPPTPYLFLLSHQGVLCCFSIVNLKEGVPKLCTPPEPLFDVSGLVHFTIGDNDSVRIQTTSTNLVKPTPVAQTSLQQQQQTKIPAFGASTPPSWGNITSPVSIGTQKAPQTPTFFNKPATGIQNILGTQSQTIITPTVEGKKAENVQENIQKPITPQTMPQTTTGLQQQNVLFGMSTQPSWAFTPPQTTLVPQKAPQPAATTFFNKPPTQSIFGTQPQPVIESQKADSTQDQKSFSSNKPVVSSVEPKETSGMKTPPAGIPAINEETEKLLAQMMKEECINLEMEIKVLMAGSNIKIDFGADSETMSFIEGATALQDFLHEMDETSSTQAAEVHALKQNMIQTWVWYEEARSRYATYKDPALKSLLALQPLDAASERKLDEIRRMIYYLESQLMQANSALDDQWDSFQSSCKRKINTKSLSIESIYQVMVKQNATLQKQIYILKDISMRIRAKLRSLNAPRLLVSLDNTEPLEEQLKSLHMEPKDMMELRYEKVFKKQQKLTKEREDKLKACFQNGNVSHVVVRKPQLNSFMEMSGLGVIPFSPIAPKKNQGEVKKQIDFVQSTPLVKVTQEKENISSPAVVNLFNKQEQQSVGGDVKTSAFVPMVNTKNNLFGNLDQNISKQQNWQKPVGETKTPFPTSSSGLVTTNTNLFKPFSLSTTVETKTPEVAAWNNTKPFSFFGQGVKATSENSPFSGSLSKPLFGSKSSLSSPDVSKAPNFGNTSQSSNDLKTTFTQNITKTTAPSLFNQGSTSTAPTIKWDTKGFPASSSTWVVTSVNQEKASIGSTKPTLTNVTVQSSLLPTTKLEQTPPTPIINIPTFRQTNTAGLTFGGTTITSSVSVPVATTKPPPIIQSTFPTSSSVVSTDSVAATTPSTTTSLISATTTTATATTVSTPMFGVTTTTSIFGQKPSIFSQPVAEGQSIFAKTASNFMQNTQATTANNSPSIFSNTGITSSFKLGGETPSGQTTGTTPAVADQAPTIFESATSASFGQTPTTGGPVASVSSATSIFGQAVSAPSSFDQITPPSSTTLPAFGQTTPSTSIGFGSTALTQTSTSSVFGQPQVSSTPSVFGQTTTVTPSVFARTVTTTSPTSVFAQTVTTTSPTSVFGQTVSTPSVFGQTTSVQSVFGQSNVFQQKTTSSSIFSPTPTSDFGKVANPVFGTATTTSTVFGQSQQQPVFGQANTLFGGTTTASIFGQPTTSSSIFGQPTTSTSSIFGQPTTSTSSVFGQPTTSTTPIFGQPTTPTSSVFGQPVTSTSSVFGQPVTSTSSVFGQPTTSTTSVFGQPTTSTSSVFGQPTTSTASVFGQSITSTPSVFGQAVTSTPSIFGQAATSTPSVFGQSSFGSNSIFKSSTNSVFGGSSPFGSTPTTSSAFGSTSPFGASNVFGGNTTNNVFGKPSFGTADNLNFGSLSTGSNPTPATSSSVFGGSSFNTFRTADKDQSFGGTSTNIFEPPTTSTTPVFGGSLFNKTTPAFGAPATFGAAPTFSQPSAFGSSFNNTFGSTNQAAGPFSGGASTQSVSQSGFGSPTSFQKQAFGSPSAFGAQPTAFGSPAAFGGAAFGSAPSFGSPNRVFGSNEAFGAAPQQQNSTFANLANQQTIGFGSVAQQAAPVENMQQPSFAGGSSFTSWR